MSDYFECPHCNTRLKKSAVAHVLGRADQFVVLGSMPSTIPCPACHHPINTNSMIAGRYDTSEPISPVRPELSLASCVVMFVIPIVLGAGQGYWYALKMGKNLAEGAGSGAVAFGFAFFGMMLIISGIGAFCERFFGLDTSRPMLRILAFGCAYALVFIAGLYIFFDIR